MKLRSSQVLHKMLKIYFTLEHHKIWILKWSIKYFDYLIHTSTRIEYAKSNATITRHLDTSKIRQEHKVNKAKKFKILTKNRFFWSLLTLNGNSTGAQLHGQRFKIY